MIFLITQILISLLLAGVAGGAAGWLLHRWRNTQQLHIMQRNIQHHQQQLNQAHTDVAMLTDDYDDLKQRSQNEIDQLRQESAQLPVLHQNLEKSQLLVRQLMQRHEAQLRELTNQNDVLSSRLRTLQDREQAFTKLQAELDLERRRGRAAVLASEAAARPADTDTAAAPEKAPTPTVEAVAAESMTAGTQLGLADNLLDTRDHSPARLNDHLDVSEPSLDAPTNPGNEASDHGLNNATEALAEHADGQPAAANITSDAPEFDDDLDFIDISDDHEDDIDDDDGEDALDADAIVSVSTASDDESEFDEEPAADARDAASAAPIESAATEEDPEDTDTAPESTRSARKKPASNKKRSTPAKSEVRSRKNARKRDRDPQVEPMFEPVDQHDDLKQIFGIGPVTEKTLNQLGITSYSQLADLKKHDIEKIAEALQIFPGRIERDNWVGGARRQLEEVLEDL